jgi:hypothetical protein
MAASRLSARVGKSRSFDLDSKMYIDLSGQPDLRTGSGAAICARSTGIVITLC